MAVSGVAEMSNYQPEEKLKNVLAQFLNTTFKISDDTCFEKLLTHLSDQNDNTLHPICLDWFDAFLSNTDSDPSVTSFAVRLIAQFASTSSGCRLLRDRDILDRLHPLLEVSSGDPSVKLAHVLLLSSLIKHEDGRAIVVEQGWWQDGVALCHKAQSMYVTRDGHKFVTELLKHVGRPFPDISRQVLRHVLQPVIDENASKSSINLTNTHNKCLSSSLTLLRNILEECLVDDCFDVPRTLLSTFDIESEIWSLFLRSSGDPSLADKTSKLLMLIYFAAFRMDYDEKVEKDEIVEADMVDLEGKVFGLVSALIARKDVSNILNACVYCHLMWSKIFRGLEDSAASNHLLNRLTILQLMPLITSLGTRTADNECLDSYCNKLFAMTSTDAHRVCYSFRETMLGMDGQHEMARDSILSILQLENILHRNRAVLVFQALMYKLKDFVPDCHLSPDAVGNDNTTRHPDLLAAVLESLATLIKTYSVTWRESVETICLVNFTQLLLKDPNMSTKLCVLALKLIEVAIIKFMPPNLALLMDTLEGSTIDQLGPLLQRKLNDAHWEVRDSALEVLQVVASISNIKFPAFQAHLMENGLCSLALRLACDDGEGYVRASALKCLAQMVRVRAFWEQCLATQDLTKRVIHILQTESEGIVRMEAASLMKEIYHHQHVPKSMLPAVYETMSHAVVGDLYWEVEVNALGFWSCVIERHMSDQGMIDGAFPGVTFAKEKRKIVTLTPGVIVERLGRVVKELERLGCLQILLTALEDCDVEVARKAAEILTSLAKTMSTYGVIPSQDPDTPTFDISNQTDVSMPSGVGVHKTNSPHTAAITRASRPAFNVGSVTSPVADTAKSVLDPAMETDSTGFNYQGSDVLFHEFLSYRGDKRKLNAESVAGSSEVEELGFGQFSTGGADFSFGAAEKPKDLLSNNLSSNSTSNPKMKKIFKIDNLGDTNSESGTSIEKDDNLKFKSNNMRSKYDLGCVPLSFGEMRDDEIGRHGEDVSISNNLDGNNGNLYLNNAPTEPRYKDDLFLNGFSFDGKRSNLPEAQVRKPKVDNATANPSTRYSNSDKIIEDIVQDTDMNLLATVYSSQMSIADKTIVPLEASITAEEFLVKLSELKLDEILAERNRWLLTCGDLVSLLDDILAVNSNSECSALDCY